MPDLDSILDSFADLLPRRAPGETAEAAGFAGGGEALALAAHAKKYPRPALFLARDAAAAAHLAEELSFFAPDIPARLLTDWENLPFDRTPPPPETAARRMAALSAMLRGGITVAAAPLALFPFAPPGFIAARVFHLRAGEKINPAQTLSALAANGYARADRVLEAGEFAAYGGQIDIFPPDAETPFRLVLEDEEIEQIRLFDPQTQLSSGKIKELRLLPAGECDLSPEGAARFRDAFAERFGAANKALPEKILRGEAAGEAAFLLPLFFGGAARLLDYAPPETLVVMHEECAEALRRFAEQAARRQQHAEVYERRAVLPAEEVFLPPAAFFDSLKKFSAVMLRGAAHPPPEAAINRRLADPHAPLKKALRETRGKIIIAADSAGRRDSLHSALVGENREICMADSFAACRGNINLTVALLRGGFAVDGLTVLTETEIFDTRPPPRIRRPRPAEDAEEFTVGDFVAHRDYGIGRYAGIAERTAGGKLGEFLRIEYAEGQVLWLPAAHLHLLARHYGAAEPSKLGGAKWMRARARAEKNARDTAAKLLDIQARRAAATGAAHSPDETALARFAAGFPHEETAGQAAAMRDVLRDMRGGKPMDRLIAADVGFGKTEIAMRAVCACVLGGRQAAVLAPTTLLAEQHARNFADRFSGMPARIELFSRLAKGKEKKQSLAALADGRADIAIGTHALLQTGTRFHNLGLAVIDEEHRFGVRQKEHFKTLRAAADVLSLSATPIPRTMALAMKGLRDISIIATPPAGRLAARTVAAPFSRELIIDACEREILRGGQIYFVHNEIRTLSALADQLREWLPAAKIAVAHGRMNAAETQRAMRRFVRGEDDMLLATTIVESGLDIAAANTMIINRADCMGAARLHQLRGRVGRAGAQAFAYFLFPPEGAATKKGEKRLDAAVEHGALGDGWHVAMRDLETRGAGEILGERQSGEIAAVGYAMYQKMLNAAVRRLAAGDGAADIETIVELQTPARLPADYVHSVGERLRYYRLLSRAADADAVAAVAREWKDRFGALPEAAQILIACHELRLLAAAADAVQMRANGNTAAVEFRKNPKCHAALVQKIAAGECRPGKDGRAVIVENLSETPAQCAIQLADFLRPLTK